MGNFGYVMAILQIIGFGAGGFFCYIQLTTQLFCENCNKYYSKKGSLMKRMDDKGEAEQLVEKIKALFNQGTVQSAINELKMFGAEKQPKLKKNSAEVTITGSYCKECLDHQAKVIANIWDGRNYTPLKDLEATVKTREDLQFK